MTTRHLADKNLSTHQMLTGLTFKQLSKNKQKKNNIALNGTNLPLLCSHPSLTITTLVMLVARMEDPGFSQGETTLSPKFPSLNPAQEPGDGVLEFIAVFSMVVTY